MNRSVNIVLLVDNDVSALVDRVQYALELMADTNLPFQLILFAKDADQHPLEAAHDLAQQYPQVCVVEQGTRGTREALAAWGELAFVQDSPHTFDASRLRQICRAEGRTQGWEPAGPEASSISGSRVRMAALRSRRPSHGSSARLRIDNPDAANRTPLPFSVRAREATRSDRPNRALAFAELRKRQ